MGEESACLDYVKRGVVEASSEGDEKFIKRNCDVGGSRFDEFKTVEVDREFEDV